LSGLHSVHYCMLLMCLRHFLLDFIVWQKFCWGKISGFPRAPKRTKRQPQHLANYLLAPALQNSQRCGESENAVERQPHMHISNFLAKSVGERFGLGRPLYCLLLLARFFRLSELTGPDGLAKENRPNVRRS